MKPKNKKILWIVASLLVFCGLVYFTSLISGGGDVQTEVLAEPAAAFLWQYQCIDTTKFSRDTARQWAGDQSGLSKTIDRQLAIIKDMGANCVALGTPYDDEFVPFLRQWVQAARKENLAVWFRGNFSGWEGWFSYPKLANGQEHNQKTFAFVTNNPDLFKEGDIFTPAPEPENGIVGNPFASPGNKRALTDFLLASYDNCQKAFKQINKNVGCGYFSTSGNVAKDILTPDLVKRIGNTVVVDNYVDSADKMSLDIEYLNRLFQTKIILGEFGAPIPDINGQMDESRQASFVGQLMAVFYSHKDGVLGLNYWVLEGGTTALLRDDGSKKPVTDVIANYFKPAVVQGKVTDGLGRPLEDAEVGVLIGGVYAKSTDARGNFSFAVPAGEIDLVIQKKDYKAVKTHLTALQNTRYVENIKLQPAKPSGGYRLRILVHNIFK